MYPIINWERQCMENSLFRQADHKIEIDLHNTNQVLLKSEFFAINRLETTHQSPINDEIILKEVKATLLLDKVTKDYKLLCWWPGRTTFVKKYITGCDMC